MFLDLPIELQHKIYDELEIEERMKLNSVLTSERRIKQTTKTNEKLDKELAMVAYLFKKKKVKPNTMSHKLQTFITSNKDDPTVQRLLREDPELTTTTSATGVIFMNDFFRGLVHKLIEDNYTESDTFAITDDIAKQSAHFPNKAAFVSWCWDATLPKFTKMLNNMHLYKVFKVTVLKSTQYSEYFMFNLINYQNTYLIRYILRDAYTAFPEDQELWMSLVTCVKSCTFAEKFVGRLDGIMLYHEEIGLSLSGREYLLQIAIEQCIFDVARYLIEIGGKL